MRNKWVAARRQKKTVLSRLFFSRIFFLIGFFFFFLPRRTRTRPKSHDFTTFSAPYPKRVPAIISYTSSIVMYNNNNIAKRQYYTRTRIVVGLSRETIFF